MDERTEPDDATLDAERAEAGRDHTADRPPTTDEEQAADRAAAQPDSKAEADVAEHAREMAKLGANVKGEGQID